MGRPLGYNEILCINTARTIINAYKSRQGSKNMVEWAKNNQKDNIILNHAMRLVHG